jgi:hypothetical protein
MNFERMGNSEVSVRLILESVIEQLADELQSEVKVISSDSDRLVFQPLLIPEINSEQRVGPSLEFVESFLKNMIVRLESLHPDINWENGLRAQVSDEGIVTILVGYNELDG